MLTSVRLDVGKDEVLCFKKWNGQLEYSKNSKICSNEVWQLAEILVVEKEVPNWKLLYNSFATRIPLITL